MMRSHAGLLVLLAAGLALSACSGKAKVREPAELIKIENPQVQSKAVWSARAGKGGGKNYSALTVVPQPDAVFTADIKGRVFALDPTTGKSIWTTDTESRIVAGPSLSGGNVYVGTLDAEVIALSRADGKEIWLSTVNNEVLAPPVSDGNVVIVRSVDGSIAGLSEIDGEQLWSLDRKVPSLTLRGLAEPVLFAGVAVIGLDNGRLLAVRMEDGQPIWEQVIAVPGGRTELERLTDVDGQLVVSPNGVFAISYGAELASIRVVDGEVNWRRSIKGNTGVTLHEDLIISSDEAGVVWALDAESGAAAWKLEELQYRRLSRPQSIGDYIVVSDFEGYLHWLSPRDGRIVGRSRVASDPLIGAPVEYEGELYTLAADGRVRRSAIEALSN